MCERALDKKSKITFSNSLRIPILVRFGPLSRHISDWQNRKDSPCPSESDCPDWLLHYLDSMSKNFNWNISSHQFKTELQQGRCVILFDALGEAPNREMREHLRNLVSNIALAYPKCQVDFWGSYVLAFIAYFIYLIQLTSPFRLMDFLTPYTIFAVFGGMVTAMVGSILGAYIGYLGKKNQGNFGMVTGFIVSTIVAVILFLWVLSNLSLLISFFVAAVVVTVVIKSYLLIEFHKPQVNPQPVKEGKDTH